MTALRYFYHLPDSLFMYGMITDAGGIFPRAQACCGPSVSTGPAGSGTYGWDMDGSYADWYAAHEIGHTLGRAHPNPNSDDPSTEKVTEGCGHSRSDPNYPYPLAHIGPADDTEGFDAGDPLSTSPAPSTRARSGRT